MLGEKIQILSISAFFQIHWHFFLKLDNIQELCSMSSLPYSRAKVHPFPSCFLLWGVDLDGAHEQISLSSGFWLSLASGQEIGESVEKEVGIYSSRALPVGVLLGWLPISPECRRIWRAALSTQLSLWLTVTGHLSLLPLCYRCALSLHQLCPVTRSASWDQVGTLKDRPFWWSREKVPYRTQAQKSTEQHHQP